jgi:nucleotide-binding universal stress UspA family protein
MYRKILLCYDGTAEGRRALRQGAEVAVSMHSATYLLAICRSLLATSVPEGVTSALLSCEEDTANALLLQGVQLLKDRGVVADGSLVYGDPLTHIPLVSQRIGADLIVVGHRSRGRLARWWSESEEVTLLSRVSCSILVAMAPASGEENSVSAAK